GLLPDAMEMNSCNHDARCARIARMVAGDLKLPLVNTGDVHALSMIDRFWIETAAALTTADDIRRIVLTGAYTLHGPAS
ncbi:MAG: hypothetical protein J7M14_04375, partial [Planctomycetes bacterium]|nr:hypothetical protein [Planctomycetota bacterium]